MEVQCGNQTRVIRSDILDRDMFDAAANTPEHTAWTMQLLQRLDKAVGPSVMDRPVFPIDESAAPPLEPPDSPVLRDLSAGKYDGLFWDAAEKPSALYRAAQDRPPLSPGVQLLSSEPVAPEVFVAPTYPPVAQAADMQGTVFFTIYVDAGGHIIDITFEKGAPIFQAAVKSASSNWKFPPNLTIPWVRAVVKFSLNCLPPPK
jgi:TonB family protein